MPPVHTCAISLLLWPLSVTLGVCPSGSVWPPCSLVLLAHPMVVHFCVPKGLFPAPQLPLPLLGSERSWARGKGEVGGDGSEEIEHSVSGLNGHVSRRASGCQMMDGVGTILHPPEHRALAPLPPTTQPIPPSSLGAPSPTLAWAPAT